LIVAAIWVQAAGLFLTAATRRFGWWHAASALLGLGTATVYPTASTLLNESGLWHADAIERALAHQDANSVRRAHARGEYWDERVRMADWWADYLNDLRIAKPPPAP
jgi:hypothetical protein